MLKTKESISSLSLKDLCAYCGERQSSEWDHIVPESKGGPTIIENLVPVCSTCNSRKGGKSLYKFRLYLKSKGLKSDFETPNPQRITGTAYRIPGKGFTKFVSDDRKTVMKFDEYISHLFLSKKYDDEASK